MFSIDLNKESAAVLLRCLAYGQSAISSQEHKQGIDTVILGNIGDIRKRICKELSEEIISETAAKDFPPEKKKGAPMKQI